MCERCWLLQLDGAGPVEAALTGQPPYAVSETMRQHALDFVADALSRIPGGVSQPRVIELASHGAYLQPFLAERGVESRIEGSEQAFDAAGAERLVRHGGQADLVIDNYLLAHLQDPGAFAAGLRTALKPTGLAVLELAHARSLVVDGTFDSIRHGHFSYLGLGSLGHLLARHGLRVVDVSDQPVYGGALRVFVAHAQEHNDGVAPDVERVLAEERLAGLFELSTYARFAERVAGVRDQLTGYLAGRRADGATVVGYGAPSRASTLLNYAGVTPQDVAFTVDRSPAKQGRLLPGCRIPIEDPSKVFAAKPADLLILTWDIRAEVERQMSGIRAWGGRFVLPLPRLGVQE